MVAVANSSSVETQLISFHHFCILISSRSIYFLSYLIQIQTWMDCFFLFVMYGRIIVSPTITMAAVAERFFISPSM